jgi:VIT1/CCC1 family predicted Fe2+/Mn2+ transporter
MISPNLRKIVLGFQKKEITEHEIYKKLAEKTRGNNAKVLKTISEDELSHYNEWMKYTQEEVHPNNLSVLKYLIFSKIFGLTFVMKILEGGEEKAQEAYQKISSELPEATQRVLDEHRHENLLIEQIDEARLNYLGSIVQGLNDALIELAGELAGFTFALQNPQLIGFAGLIAGIAQFLSGSASEIEIYLSQKTEENKQALKASFHEGIIYMITVLLLITPYFISTNYYIPLSVTAITAFLIILLFTYYVSVVRSLSLKRMFFSIVTITVGVGAVAFLIGWIAKMALNL